ncbi:MAG: ATP-binding protein [Selenomonadaceae bacterium]|nr:ATP-binding protein [Selenomonadaceae bacterium]
MKTLLNNLIIYQSFKEDLILTGIARAVKEIKKNNGKNLSKYVYPAVHELLDIATVYGFNKNLWKCYIAYLAATTETPFTLASERQGALNGSVNNLVMRDLSYIYDIYNYDFSKLDAALPEAVFKILTDYKAVQKSESIVNLSVSEKVLALMENMNGAKNPEELYKVLTDFYRTYGVGELGLNRAFRLDDSGKVTAITHPGKVTLDEIALYDSQKQRLEENTVAFLNKKPANNVLLYGDAGTGKSTMIKGLLAKYESAGLRMIEIYKHEFKHLSKVVSQIKNRNYRFIIYLDDLSFEEFEIEYKYLKAIIEGGLELCPENVLIYATSNRRHLIRETWEDRPDAFAADMHQNDTVTEKLSLSERFGLKIGFFRPSQQEFFSITKEIAKREGLNLTDEELFAEANKFSMSHSGLSGRTAKQCVKYLLSR